MSVSRDQLARFLCPASVAIVGASENQARSTHAFGVMRDAGTDVVLVNPNRAEVYGRPTYPTVSAAGRSIDAVLCLVGAGAAASVVADCSAAGAGGAVVIAGGFSENGGEGGELEVKLLEAAGSMPVLGPNCNGFVRPAQGIRLSGAPPMPMPSGGVGVITHSGALLAAFGLDAIERGIGISTVISTGNEMQIGLADCLDFLVDDDETRVIALVIETIRHPAAFVAAARRALAAGKPVVALKLGRSERGREIATSHTGALAGEAWVYDAALRQVGIPTARDLEDLMDQVSLCVQLPPERWSEVQGLGVVSMSGGWSAMTGDICDEEGIVVPPLHKLRPQINELVPNRTTINPLDMTGFALGRHDLVKATARVFVDSREIDALALQWFIDESAGASAEPVADAARDVASLTDMPVVVCGIDDSRVGAWARALNHDGVAVGRGIRATVRGLRAMAFHVRHRSRQGDPAATLSESRDLPPGQTVPSSIGPLLSFGATMSLLSEIGVPTAPYVIVEGALSAADLQIPFAGPYAVKLADVPHRTELGAVRLRVSDARLLEVISELGDLAATHDVPPAVAIQPSIEVAAEAFLGLEPHADLGPLVVCGLGGVGVEANGAVTGRIAPLSAADVDDLLEELAEYGVFETRRGSVPWDAHELGELLRRLSSFALAASSWMQSLDVNPLAVTPDGFVAVDGLCVLRGRSDPTSAAVGAATAVDAGYAP